MQRSYHPDPQSDRGITSEPDGGITQAGSAGLDWLRLAALAALVLYHVACVYEGDAGGGVRRGALALFRLGYLGTDILLALAGFLAVGSLARSGNPSTFLLRRYLRVLPALAVFLVAYLYAFPALLGDRVATLPNYAGLERAREIQGSFWTLTANFPMVGGARLGAALEPMLTLGVGAQLTALVAFLLPKRRRLFWGTLAVFLVGMALRIHWLHSDDYVPYSFPLSRGDGFLLGAVLASLSRSEPDRVRLFALRYWLLGATSVALAALVVLQKGLPISSPAMKIVGYPLVGAWSACLVLVVARLPGCPGFPCLLSRLGRMGFCVYLVKLPVVFLVLAGLSRWARPGVLTLALAALSASFAVGAVFHWGLERPVAAGLAHLFRAGKRGIG